MVDELNDPTLVPEDIEVATKYAWDEDYQRHVMALLLADRQFLLQSIDLIKPSYFTNKAHQKACHILFRFFREYRLLPQKVFLVQELKSELKDNKSLAYYLGEVNTLYDYVQPGFDSRDYLMDKIAYFAKIQAVKTAFYDALKDIDKAPEAPETWDKIYGRMQAAMTVEQNYDLGLDYFKTVKERYLKMEQDLSSGEFFITNFPSVDSNLSNGGFCKGEVLAVIAGSGVGKSVCATCITAVNLMRAKKGLYLSCELADHKIANRMDAIMTGFPIKTLLAHKEDIFKSLEATKGLAETKPGQMSPFIIKKFAAGTATVNTFRAYMAQLKFHGFTPDFVVVDYVGEMRDYSDMKTYQSRERIVRELRAMADEEGVFVLTLLQPNRTAMEAQGTSNIDQQHLSDSMGQIRPLDGAFAIMQNDNERKAGLARGFMMKTRDGDSRFNFWLRFDKANLRMTEITQQQYKHDMATQTTVTENVADTDHIKDIEAQVAENEAKENVKKRLKKREQNPNHE